MAIVTRRYKFVGPPDSQLAREVGAAAQNVSFPTSCIDIDIEDSVAGSVVGLDEFMQLQGWEYDPEFSQMSRPRVLYIWGNSDIGGAADTRYLSPGHDFALASISAPDVLQIPITRPGQLQRLAVRHNTDIASEVGEVLYTVMVNEVATGIEVSLSAGVVGQAFDLVHTHLVDEGDRVHLRVQKPVEGLNDGLVNVQATLECEDI